MVWEAFRDAFVFQPKCNVSVDKMASYITLTNHSIPANMVYLVFTLYIPSLWIIFVFLNIYLEWDDLKRATMKEYYFEERKSFSLLTAVSQLLSHVSLTKALNADLYMVSTLSITAHILGKCVPIHRQIYKQWQEIYVNFWYIVRSAILI